MSKVTQWKISHKPVSKLNQEQWEKEYDRTQNALYASYLSIQQLDKKLLHAKTSKTKEKLNRQKNYYKKRFELIDTRMNDLHKRFNATHKHIKFVGIH